MMVNVKFDDGSWQQVGDKILLNKNNSRAFFNQEGLNPKLTKMDTGGELQKLQPEQ
jgi:hypothetical protein